MKVVCNINNLTQISNQQTVRRLKRYVRNVDGEVGLDVGKEYTVYGILFVDNTSFYYICKKENFEWPVAKPIEFFKVIDDRLSSYWKLHSEAIDEEEVGSEVGSELVFDEWAKDPTFYERLLDGEPDAEAIFAKYRKLMDKEFQ